MSFLKKIISYPLTIIYYIFFGFLLLIFHPLQWVSFNLFGLKLHAKVMDILNFFLVKSFLLLGVVFKFKKEYEIPENSTLIFVVNQQSVADSPAIGWFLRKYHPKFVAKIELKKGFPSISYNLRNGGGALINRKDPKQAISELIKFSKRINKHKWGSIIFPEGTRSKNGVPKKFATTGIKIPSSINRLRQK